MPSLLSREFLGPRLPVPSCPDVAAAPQLSAAGGSAQRGAARLHHGLRQRHRGVLRRSRRCSPGGRLPRAVSPVRPPPCPALPRLWGRRPPRRLHTAGVGAARWVGGGGSRNREAAEIRGGWRGWYCCYYAGMRLAFLGRAGCVSGKDVRRCDPC